MRCPKCGYISFDDPGNCSKCKKDISSTSETIQGAVFHVAAPIFLQFDAASSHETAGESYQDEGEETADLDMEYEEGDGGIAFDFDDEAGGDETIDFVETTDEEPEETVIAQEVEEVQEGQPEPEKAPHMDFGDIDLSDLGPPEEEAVVAEETLALDDGLTGEAAPSSATGSGFGLEDLQVGDLDLDGPAPPVQGSATGKKIMPGTKTGTALDEFDIDLGELFPEK